jgi:hypothetical protein
MEIAAMTFSTSAMTRAATATKNAQETAASKAEVGCAGATQNVSFLVIAATARSNTAV